MSNKSLIRFFIFLGYIPLLGYVYQAKGQNIQENPIVTTIVQDFLENNDAENFDFNTVFENLIHFQQHNININSASEEQLRDLVLLSEPQIRDLINHREKFGPLLTLYELQVLPSWNLSFIRNILPFITVDKGFEQLYAFNWKEFYREGESDLYLKAKRVIQNRKGYLPNNDGVTPYEGDPNSFYLRYRYKAGNYFQFGITAEKDPGESFFKGSNPNGFDFYSFFLFGTQLNEHIKTMSLGDYTVSMGQGLILHNDFGGRKSSFVMNIKKGNRFLRHYSSVNEVNFFRGAAVEFQKGKHWKLGLLASYKPIDTGMSSDTTENTDFDLFTSIVQSGFHRTSSEIASRNRSKQFNTGGTLKWENNNIRLGINYLYTGFDKPFDRREDLYLKYTFRGQQLHNMSFDYQFQRKNATLFGEFAMSDNGGTASTTGLLLSLDRRIDLSALYRNFSAEYQVLNANAFADASLPINENGLYTGLEIRPFPKLTLSTYIDFWKNPWASYRRDGPAKGLDYFVKIQYVLKRKLDIYLQYRYINKQLNPSSDLNIAIYGPVDYFLQRCRLHFSYKITPEWEWRNRIEFSFYNKDEMSSGILAYQDILYKPIARPFSFSARYCIFDIDSYDARIYTYENDILFEFFVPFFQHRGSRIYANFRYRINRWLTWEMRVSNTYYTQDGKIGSGNEYIDGRNRTEFKTQCKLSF